MESYTAENRPKYTFLKQRLFNIEKKKKKCNTKKSIKDSNDKKERKVFQKERRKKIERFEKNRGAYIYIYIVIMTH